MHWGTGTVLAISSLALIVLLTWQSQGRIGSLLGVIGLFYTLDMLLGGLALIAWGRRLSDGRTLDAVVTACLAGGSILFFALSFISRLLVGVRSGITADGGQLMGFMVFDGAVAVGSFWVIVQLIYALSFVEDHAAESKIANSPFPFS